MLRFDALGHHLAGIALKRWRLNKAGYLYAFGASVIYSGFRRGFGHWERRALAFRLSLTIVVGLLGGIVGSLLVGSSAGDRFVCGIDLILRGAVGFELVAGGGRVVER